MYLLKKLAKSLVITALMIGLAWLGNNVLGIILGYVNHAGVIATLVTNFQNDIITLQTLMLRYAPLIALIVFIALCINDCLDYVSNLITGKKHA